MSRRRQHRRDANHRAIVAALRAIGATVLDLADVGGGAPDLLVGYRGEDYLMELKSDTGYGRRGATAEQVDWAESWRGSCVFVVRTELDAVKIVIGDHDVECR